MKIYAVVSTSPSWMNGGYGVSLLAAEHRDLLVPFEEFSKKPGQQLRPLGMPTPETYDPKKLAPVEIRNDRIAAFTFAPS